MIPIKEAFRAATEFAQELYGTERVVVTLEEVEHSPDERDWLITLGFANRAMNPLVELAGANVRRDYKIFRVDGETGEVRSMKIRSAA
jgi:hypothetical protein